MKDNQIRLHYQTNYLLTDYTPNFDALVDQCSMGFEYEKESNAIHYHLVLFTQLKPIPVTKDTYQKYPYSSIMEILITNDFDEKIDEDDLEDEEPTEEFSSILLTNEKKKVQIGKSYVFFMKIKNNGRNAWPLPLTLSPTINSTIFSADYPLSSSIAPKQIAIFRIKLIELEKKPLGEYTLFLQLKKGKASIGKVFEYKFEKIE